MSTATIKNDTEVLQWSKEGLLYGHASRLTSKATESQSVERTAAVLCSWHHLL